MDLTFLTALGDLKIFPAYGLLALVAWLLFTGRLMPSSAAVREIERAQKLADRDAERNAKDRDDRIEAKNDEIARLTVAYDAGIARTAAAHNAEVTRAREAEQQWRDAWRESQDIAAEVRSQNRELVDSLYFVRKIVGALPRPDGGGEDT